jgi:hypothetical protein
VATVPPAGIAAGIGAASADPDPEILDDLELLEDLDAAGVEPDIELLLAVLDEGGVVDGGAGAEGEAEALPPETYEYLLEEELVPEGP